MAPAQRRGAAMCSSGGEGDAQEVRTGSLLEAVGCVWGFPWLNH